MAALATAPSFNILLQIRLRDKLLRDARKSKDLVLFGRFKETRNLAARFVRNAKRQFLFDKLEEHQHDSRKLWD